MFDYKEYVDYHAVLAFLVRYYVFVVFFGLSIIAFWLPDYKKHKLGIIAILIILVVTCSKSLLQPVILNLT